MSNPILGALADASYEIETGPLGFHATTEEVTFGRLVSLRCSPKSPFRWLLREWT